MLYITQDKVLTFYFVLLVTNQISDVRRFPSFPFSFCFRRSVAYGGQDQLYRFTCVWCFSVCTAEVKKLKCIAEVIYQNLFGPKERCSCNSDVAVCIVVYFERSHSLDISKKSRVKKQWRGKVAAAGRHIHPHHNWFGFVYLSVPVINLIFIS